MNKLFIIPAVLSLILFSSLISAVSPTITLNSREIIDSNRYGDNIFLGTGDYIIASINVQDSDGDLRGSSIRWGTSWVPCIGTRDGTYTSFEKDYTCTMTVTPFMNTNMDVFILAESRNGNSQMSIGNFEFRGWQFPTYNNTHERQYPRRTTSCHTEQICSRYDDAGDCVRTRNRRICTR